MVASLNMPLLFYGVTVVVKMKFLKLHRLKIKYRIIYKMILIVHNCLKQNAPKEIMSLIEPGDPDGTLHLDLHLILI